MLRPLLLTWYACAKQLRDVELSIKLLIEMLGHGKSIFMQLYQVNHDLIDEPDSEDPSLLEEDLVAVLKVCILIVFVNTS